MSGRKLPSHALRRLLADAAPLLSEAREDGRTVGRYRLIRELGRGGMGVVWEAEDPQLGRRVALKVLTGVPGADGVLRERFRREGQAAARLSHPNIAQVYEASGEAIAMQLIDGPPLSRFPRDDRRLLVTLMRDAALAVHHAHERGVIHRDLKPHNLLVEDGRVYVTDFGLAKRLEEASDLSLTGHLLGTPSYMSPEQAAGRVDEVDPRTDVYGLGATLFDLLGGSPPHRRSDVALTIRSIIENDAPRLRSLVPDIPGDLELVVAKCLESEPARRYRSAAQLADELTRWLEGRPVLAEPKSITSRGWKFVKRRPAAVALVLISATALVFGEVARDKANEADAIKRASRVTLGVDVALQDARMHRVRGDVAAADRRLDREIERVRSFAEATDLEISWYSLGRLLHARGRIEDAERAFDRACADPSLEMARIGRGLVRLERLAGELAGRLPPVFVHEVDRMDPGDRRRQAAALDDLLVIHDQDALTSVEAAYVRAEIHRLRGDLAAAKAELAEVTDSDPLHVGARRARSQIELAEGNADAAWHAAFTEVDIYRGLGAGYLARGGSGGPVDRAVRQFELAEADRRVRTEGASSEALLMRGNARLAVRDVVGALSDLSAVLDKDPDNALAFGHRALAHARRAVDLSAQSRFTEALDAWDDAIADDTSAVMIDENLVGARNNRSVARIERARILGKLDRHEDAWRELRRARDDLDAVVAAAPRFGLAWLNRALVHRQCGWALARAEALTEAAASVRRARRDLIRMLELKPGDGGALLERALLHALEAHILDRRGQAIPANAAYARALSDHDAAVEANPDQARPRGLRGVFLLSRGERDAAVRDLTVALKMGPGPGLRQTLEAALTEAETGR